MAPSVSVIPETERDHIYRQLCRVWGIDIKSTPHNPCALAVALERGHLSECTPRDYLITPKTDGTRFLLLMTLRDNGRPVAVMISRTMEMYEIEVYASMDVFRRGTLLDGELVSVDDGEYTKLVYLVFDAMCIRGESIATRELVLRLEAVRSTVGLTKSHVYMLDQYEATLNDEYLRFIVEERKIACTPNNNASLEIRPKEMQLASDWTRGDAKDDAYRSDGFVLTPRHLPVYLNTHHRMFKWKPSHCTTIDIEFIDNVPHLHDSGALSEIVALEGCPVVTDVSTIDDGVYECRVTLKKGAASGDDHLVVTPVNTRHDKVSPNSFNTGNGTVRALMQNITLEELYQWCHAQEPGTTKGSDQTTAYSHSPAI